jgi:hypothetical protein
MVEKKYFKGENAEKKKKGKQNWNLKGKICVEGRKLKENGMYEELISTYTVCRKIVNFIGKMVFGPIYGLPFALLLNSFTLLFSSYWCSNI